MSEAQTPEMERAVNVTSGLGPKRFAMIRPQGPFMWVVCEEYDLPRQLRAFDNDEIVEVKFALFEADDLKRMEVFRGW